jgi:hypothetical protein
MLPAVGLDEAFGRPALIDTWGAWVLIDGAWRQFDWDEVAKDGRVLCIEDLLRLQPDATPLRWPKEFNPDRRPLARGLPYRPRYHPGPEACHRGQMCS